MDRLLILSCTHIHTCFLSLSLFSQIGAKDQEAESLQPHEPASSPPRPRELNPIRGPVRRAHVPESEEEEEEEEWVPQQPQQPFAGRLAMKLPENHKQQQQQNHGEENHHHHTAVGQDDSVRRGAVPPLSEDSIGTNTVSGRGSRAGFFLDDRAASRSVSSRVRPPVKEPKLDPDDPWSAIEVEYAAGGGGGGGYNTYLPTQEDNYHHDDYLRGPLSARNNGVELELGDDGTLVEVVGKRGGSKYVGGGGGGGGGGGAIPRPQRPLHGRWGAGDMAKPRTVMGGDEIVTDQTNLPLADISLPKGAAHPVVNATLEIEDVTMEDFENKAPKIQGISDSLANRLAMFDDDDDEE